LIGSLFIDRPRNVSMEYALAKFPDIFVNRPQAIPGRIARKIRKLRALSSTNAQAARKLAVGQGRASMPHVLRDTPSGATSA
jgi:hypothetical protein